MVSEAHSGITVSVQTLYSTGGAPISSTGSTTQGTACLCPVMQDMSILQAQTRTELMCEFGEELMSLHPFCSILRLGLFEL